MNGKCCAAVLAAAALAALSASAELSVIKIDEADRYGPASELSGITYVDSYERDLFYAVDDKQDALCRLYIKFYDDGRINGNAWAGDEVALENSKGVDVEGCAFDPASGNVWVSQECLSKTTRSLIREFSPANGAELRSAPVPVILNQSAENYSLEALTISGDGLTMWTCNEESLMCDGELSAKDTGSVVRLTIA
ncbi:MAG: esterase-like activity of phytase family protein [Kiritimatiellae bacterium]|nr:esterase-like activity of phytase family protein [Kiritimatiellia bacterium]